MSPTQIFPKFVKFVTHIVTFLLFYNLIEKIKHMAILPEAIWTVTFLKISNLIHII